MAARILASSSRSLSSRWISNRRSFSSHYFQPCKEKAVILGIYESSSEDKFELSKNGENFVAQHGSSIVEKIQSSGPPLKAGKSRILSTTPEDPHHIVIVGIGKNDSKEVESEAENHDLRRESIRTAISAGIRTLKDYEKVNLAQVDNCGDPEAAAEGAHLATWAYDDLKAKKNKLANLNIQPLEGEDKSWLIGKRKALGQNLARTIMEAPANMMTPTKFAETAKAALSPYGVEVIAHDVSWIREKKMGSFLSVTRGSHEPPVFLEMIYSPKDAAPTKPIALVGKGVTFDTGGISLKPSAKMEFMRGDLGGAASVVGALQIVSSLKLPMTIHAFTPLCENMPGGSATKPGDVVTAMNGKTIQIDNTDAEGRLILADALCYAQTCDPRLVVDLATLTGAISVALGAAACGVYTTSNKLWPIMQEASFHSGDRVWRMPLWNFYSEQMKKSRLADLNNISGKSEGGSCTAAAFLKEFVTCPHWFHMDIACVFENASEVPYLPAGLSGRPTRTLAEFLHRIQSTNFD